MRQNRAAVAWSRGQPGTSVVLLNLPFSTFDEVRDLGYTAGLYCASRYHKAAIELTDPRLAGRPSPAVSRASFLPQFLITG